MGTYNEETVTIKKYNDFLPSNDIETQYFSSFNNSCVVSFIKICCSLNALVIGYCKYGSVASKFKSGKLTEELKVFIYYDCTRMWVHLACNYEIE